MENLMKLKLFSHFILLIFLTFLYSSCKNLSSDSSQLGTDKISGNVTIEGIIVTDANIKVDEVANWQTKTDANGNFKISTLTDGEHVLYIEKNLSSGEVITYQTNMNLTQSETDLGTIDFPKPVNIINKTPTVSEIPISWAKSKFSSFKEYKVYRQEGQGVDNTNGELVYNSYANGDTSFTDTKFINGIQYSYRVYIVSNDGTLGGSKIITIKAVDDVNLISNGRFEISSDGIKPDFWQTYSDGTPSYNIFTVDGSVYHDGKSSLKINYIDSLITPNQSGSNYSAISQQISSNNFIPGATYRLTFWVKSEVGRIRVRLTEYGTNDTVRVADYFGPNQYDWSNQNIDFTMPNNNPLYLFLVISSQYSLSINGVSRVWIDGLKLAPIQ